jgi:hypothetical protein
VSAPRLDLSAGTGATGASALMTVVGMADAMKQFDSNGNQIGQAGTLAAGATKSLNLPGVQDPANNGFLVSGGR